MSLYLRKTTKLILLLSFISTPLFSIKIENLHHAVDVAGKQRMFTQRMLKDYAMIGMKNSFGNPDKDLKRIIEDFSDHLEALHTYTNNKTIQENTKKVSELWEPIKKILNETPSKEKVAKLQESLEELLRLSNVVTNLFAKETQKSSGKIVDMSGRQRMLSQRMASLYMLKVWGVNDEKFQEKMKDSMKLFKTSLETLQKSELNTDEITKLLKKVEKSFMFFEIMNKSDRIFIPTLIYKKSNDILKNMNTVTHCYVEASK